MKLITILKYNKVFALVLFSMFSSVCFSLNYKIKRNSDLKPIENGWYEATVKYTNFKTGTRSTYALKVKVEGNRVVIIDFGNDGSLHSGSNNSGYSYNGGYLSFDYDENNKLISATTKVSIYFHEKEDIVVGTTTTKTLGKTPIFSSGEVRLPFGSKTSVIFDIEIN